MEFFQSPAFASHAEQLLEKHHTPGIAIALVHHDHVASLAFGRAVTEPGQEVDCTPDTLFDIASSSKSLTAAAVALLVDDDERFPEIQWNARMSDLLPDDFVLAEAEYTRDVTLEDILSHRSGLPSHDSALLGIHAAQPDDARSVTRNLRFLPLAAPIRSKYMYSNLMYTVATHLIEVKTGISFTDFLHQRFFAPLGMTSTHLQPDSARAAGLTHRLARGYHWVSEQDRYLPGFSPPQVPEGQGPGSIITSVNDYILYVKAMIGREAPITPTMVDELTRPRMLTDERDGDPFTSPALIALGWEVFYYRGHKIVQHDGLISGFGSCHFFLPDFKFGGVLLGNSGRAEAVAASLARELIHELLSVPQNERVDWDTIETAKIEAEENEFDDPEELREAILEECADREPLKVPLTAFTGTYHHPGYHSFVVEIKDEALFIDATDRSTGFTLRFDYVCGQTKFVARLVDAVEGSVEPLRAEFELDDSTSRASKLGVHLEEDLNDLIWFARVDGRDE